MKLWYETRLARLEQKLPRGQRNVVGRAVDRGRGTGPIGKCQAEADRMPQSRLDGDQGAAGAQQVCGLGEAGSERPLVGNVVKRQPIQDYVERRVYQPEPAGVSDVCFVGSPGLHDRRDALRVGIDGYEAEFRCRKQVTARIPTAPDRQHITPLDAEPSS